MLIGVCGHWNDVAVNYLVASQGFKARGFEEWWSLFEDGREDSRTVVVIEEDGEQVEVVREVGQVVHIDKMTTAAGLELSTVERDSVEDISLIGGDAGEVLEQLAAVVAWEEADEDESFNDYLYRAGHRDHWEAENSGALPVMKEFRADMLTPA